MPGAATRAARREAVQEHHDRSGRYPRWVLLTALTGMFATSFPVTLLAVSIPTIADDFGTAIGVGVGGPLIDAVG